MMYLLLANGIGPEFIKLVIGAVFLIGWVIRKIAEANKQAAPPRRPELPQVPRPQMPGGPAPAEVGQQADQLRAQVEEFLRRAGKVAQPNQPNAPQAKPKRSPVEVQILAQQAKPEESRTFGQPLRQATWRNAPPQESTAATADKTRAARAATAKQNRRQSVAEHVAEQVASHAQSLAEKSAQLGQRIVAEDQQFDVQLKAKFDHAVGTLAGTTLPAATAEPAATTPDTPAAQLAAMLREPAGIRQAVLVNEILRRPSDRW